MNKIKKIALAALAGGVIFGGTCINWRQLLLDGAQNVAWEFVLDNDDVMDLFPDGNATVEE